MADVTDKTKLAAFPDWMKCLPGYVESPSSFSDSLYPEGIECTVELPGGNWSAQSHSINEKLSFNPASNHMLFVWKTINYFCWEAVLIVNQDKFFYCRVNGQSETASGAAEAALAHKFESAQIEDMTWYANKSGPYTEWRALTKNYQVVSVTQINSDCFDWRAEFPEIDLFKAAGMSFDEMNMGKYLSGYANSLTDAANAIKNAPLALEAACTAYLDRNK